MGEPGRRVAEEGDGRRARREGEDEGAAGEATTVTVLNGNGVTGSASNASYLLAQRGYPILTPPNGIPANAPSFKYFRTTVYFDPKQTGAKQAARKVAGLFGSADVQKATPKIRALANGAMLVDGRRADVPRHARARLRSTRRRSASPPNVVPGASASLDLLQGAAGARSTSR